MSLITKKRDVTNKIATYTSFSEQDYESLKPKNDSIESINNDKNVISFLVSILGTLVGNEGLKEIIGEIITNITQTVEEDVKKNIKGNLIEYNSNDPLPDDFTNNGYDLPITNIDTKDKFYIEPSSIEGSLIYTENSFDSYIHESIKTPNTPITVSDLDLVINYDEDTSLLNVKSGNSKSSIGDFFNNYVDSISLFNKNETITNVLDQLYGSFSKKTNRNEKSLIEEQKIRKIINETYKNNNDNLYELTNEDINNIFIKVKEIGEGGLIYNLGCGKISSSLSFSEFNELVNEIKNENDPYIVADLIEKSIYDSTKNNEEIVNKNKETIKNSFFKILIELLILDLSYAAINQPQIKLLTTLSDKFKNVEVSDDNVEYIYNNERNIKCMINTTSRKVHEFIFEKCVKYLKELIYPLIKLIIKERINQYNKTLISLTPSIKK